MSCFGLCSILYFYVSFGVFGVMSISTGSRLSWEVHGKMFDGLVFLGGYRGLTISLWCMSDVEVVHHASLVHTVSEVCGRILFFIEIKNLGTWMHSHRALETF